MRHDSSIPEYLHTGLRPDIKDALGSFWSTVFSDGDFVDASLMSRVIAASQRYIDIMEALSLRDHNGFPVFHREHWHPMFIRLGERNTGRGLTVGMQDTPVIGPQSAQDLSDNLEYLADVYLDNAIFEVGGNAEYSKVNTYPFTAMSGCDLARVGTCICDSIVAPKHMLVQGRDFSVSDGVLVIRKEQDPFVVGDYRVVSDGDDSIAVLWMCDAEFDTNNVSDFAGYPMGMDVASTDSTAKMVAAVWDLVIYGLTPRYLNTALGAIFDIPVAASESTVEQITDETDGFRDVITSDAVYSVPASSIRSGLAAGVVLHAGDFLTTDITVYSGLSADEVATLVDSGELVGLSLPAGSIYGVSDTVVIDNMTSGIETGGWFKLNSGDTADSPFWSVMLSRLSTSELTAMFSKLSGGESTLNPLKALGYVVLANTVLIKTTKSLDSDTCAGKVFAAIRRLVPSYASLVVIQEFDESETYGLDSAIETVSHDNVLPVSSTAMAASDSVAFSFVPVAATEV